MKHHTIRFRRYVWGAIKTLSVSCIAIVSVGCGGESAHSGRATQTPSGTGTPRVSAAPTSSPTLTSITYRLTEGSTISAAVPAPDLAGVPPEPLSGTFEVMPRPLPPPPPTPIEGNVLFDLVITRVDFQSSHFTVSGNAGELVGVTIPGPGQVFMQIIAAINGEAVSLSGAAPLPVISDGTINGLEILGGRYSVVIDAMSES